MADSKTLVIGIGGPSGSGKSMFAENLHSHLQKYFSVGLLSSDSYYRPQPDFTDQQKASTNYDHPDAIEADLLVDHVATIHRGETVAVPVYDFSRHDRTQETRSIPAVDFLIVDGILIFHWPELRELMDLKIFIDVPLDTCLERRIQRDAGNRGRTPDSVREQFEMSVRPMYAKYVKPSVSYADILVPGGAENPKCLEAIFAWCYYRKYPNPLAKQVK